MDVKYPEIEVELAGGNAHSIVGDVAEALRRAGVKPDEVARFRQEALSGDYDHVIQTAMKWVDVS